MLRASSIVLICLAPLAATAAEVTVNKADCTGFVAHAPDGSVAYKPGVAADGSAVAPADLPGSSFSVDPPDKITIDINIDLQKRFGLPANAAQYMGEAKIGKVTVEKGRAYFNGQELATGDSNAVLEACRKLKAAD